MYLNNNIFLRKKKKLNDFFKKKKKNSSFLICWQFVKKGERIFWIGKRPWINFVEKRKKSSEVAKTHFQKPKKNQIIKIIETQSKIKRRRKKDREIEKQTHFLYDEHAKRIIYAGICEKRKKH